MGNKQIKKGHKAYLLKNKDMRLLVITDQNNKILTLSGEGSNVAEVFIGEHINSLRQWMRPVLRDQEWKGYRRIKK